MVPNQKFSKKTQNIPALFVVELQILGIAFLKWLYVLFKESYFHWTFGVAEGDCFGAVEVDTARAILFVPRLPPEYAVWMGRYAHPYLLVAVAHWKQLKL